MTKTKPTPPTRKAVVHYTDQLRDRADRLIRQDPYAKPYYPTTAGALQVCSRLTREAYDHLKDHLSEEEARAQSQAEGAKGALRWLAAKAVEMERDQKRQDDDADRSHKRHHRRQRQAQRDREARRGGRTLGQRIDAVLAELSTVGTVKASALDSDRVTGSRAALEPRWQGDPSHRARSKADDAVRFCEEELEDARRRRVENEAA